MEQEEREAYERQVRRCQAERERLLALRGDPDAAAAVAEAWQPLRRSSPPPEVFCPMPYDAPELLP